MAQKVLLVNEWDTRERFELTVDEAHQLLDVGAAFFCLADTIYLEENGSVPVGEPFIALHAQGSLGGSRAYEAFVASISEYRGLPNAKVGPEDLNPFTGKLLKMVAPPKNGPEQN